MSPEERRRRGTKLCEKLGIEVAQIVPEGIGHWDRCWDMVGGPDVAFVVALTAWEATGLDEQLDTVRTTYHALLETWREAAHEFGQQRQGAS